MSLDFDVTKCANHEELWDGETWPPPAMTTVIVHLCMGIGWGEITEANAEEWFARVYAWERVYGSMLHEFPDGPEGERRDRYITPEDVQRYIGLVTNVFPKRSDAEFRKQLAAHLKDRAAYVWREAMKQPVA